jgi:hypothetical protein
MFEQLYDLIIGVQYNASLHKTRHYGPLKLAEAIETIQAWERKMGTGKFAYAFITVIHLEPH